MQLKSPVKLAVKPGNFGSKSHIISLQQDCIQIEAQDIQMANSGSRKRIQQL